MTIKKTLAGIALATGAMIGTDGQGYAKTNRGTYNIVNPIGYSNGQEHNATVDTYHSRWKI